MKQKNHYVNFVSDEHLLDCVAKLYKSYQKAKSEITVKDFYKNKVDTFKMTFDALFNEVDEEVLIKSEIIRQIDKSVNNALGTFHEDVLGGIMGYQVGYLTGYDIKANDNTLFADIKNKHNTMNSSSAEALFQKLKDFADQNRKASCYWVQILAKKSFSEPWSGIINGREYSHSRVYKISGDRFYALLTGEEDALYQLYKALPAVIHDYLKAVEEGVEHHSSTAELIVGLADVNKRSVINQIAADNYSYYNGFEKL